MVWGTSVAKNTILFYSILFYSKKKVPGNASYGNVVKDGKKIGLLGDSNLNRIIVKEMNEMVNTGNVIKYSYSGATAAHLGHYSDVLLEDNPDVVVIHVGTNDIHGRNSRDMDCATIAHDIINIGQKCKNRGVNTIYISSIIVTRNVRSNIKATDINNLLRSLCAENDFIFISNDFLTENDLEKNDQVHLSWDGRRKFVTNYIDILNH